jgi:uncharacterized protein (DUF1778 family)
MDMETRSTDAKGRICLPIAFANATVILDQIGDTEIRLTEKTPIILSDRDRDTFLNLLDNPPSANSALKRVATRHAKRHG